MPKSADNTLSIGREPRQTSTFMFLPGGGALKGQIPGPGVKSMFSVPTATTDEDGEGTIILKRNVVTPITHGVSSSASPSSPKKRGRPPAPVTVLPFRLPSPSEDEDRGAGQGSSGDKGLSSTGSVNNLDVTYLTLYGLKLQRNDAGLLGSFRYISQHDLVDYKGEPAKGRVLGKEELEKYIRWIRKEAPALFWTGLKESYSRARKFDQSQGPAGRLKGRRWIELVHEPATNTAIKFMGRLRNRIHPLDYVAMDEDDEEEEKDKATPAPDTPGTEPSQRSSDPSSPGSPPTQRRKIVCALDFLRRLMTGILLASEKQKVILESELDDIFEKFYYFGLRSLVGQHLNVLGKTKNNGASPANRVKGFGERIGSGMDFGRSALRQSCEWCGEAPCICEVASEAFQNANVALHSLGLMDEVAGPRLFTVIKRAMTTKIGEVGTEKVDASNIEHLKEWLNESARAWYTALYMRDTLGRLVTNPSPEFGQELTTMLLEQYGLALIKDLFAVIIEFPECKPLLDDLRTCMKAVNLRNILVSNLKSSLERRLLNAGVNTSEVLAAYIATVRALKYVDPTGILVQLVTPPVREYLKHREETVRVILISLTEESGELSEELARNPTNPDKTCKLTLKNYEEWNPDPIDVPKDKHNLRKSDLIEAMVSIYGSKTVFIDEYRALLADRLLRMPKPGSITREIKCLELLKLRFGEADLQKCEVMLKDVSDSLRLNTRFYEEDGAVLANEEMQVSALIVSAQFWPSLKQEDIVLPVPVTAALEKYTKAFEMIKGNRTLEWQKHIGTVKLEIEHGGIKANFSVSPIQATIIWHFQEQEKWSLEELSKVTGMSVSYLNSRIGFWVSKGMIIHTGQGNYMLADVIHETSKATGVIPNKYVEEGDTDSPMASTSSQRATELQVFWSYIEAMLTNLESLPLPRIHSMLKLFATVECSSDDLQKFLDDKVSQNLLVYSAGQYQLPK